jgi:hypothetical protein
MKDAAGKGRSVRFDDRGSDAPDSERRKRLKPRIIVRCSDGSTYDFSRKASAYMLSDDYPVKLDPLTTTVVWDE